MLGVYENKYMVTIKYRFRENNNPMLTGDGPYRVLRYNIKNQLDCGVIQFLGKM